MNINDSINKNLAARIRQDILHMNIREKMVNRITADEMVIKVPRDIYKQLLELSLEQLKYLNKKALSEDKA